MSGSQPHNRIRLRYSLRFLLIATAVLGIVLAWFGNRVEKSRVQRRQIERIWRLGGGVFFEEEKFMIHPVTNLEWDAELNRTWFQDAFATRTPYQVLFAGRVGYKFNVTDKDVDELADALKKLPSIRNIRLDGTDLTQDGVERLRAALPDRRFARE